MTSHVGPGHGVAAGQVGVEDEMSHCLGVEPDAVVAVTRARPLTLSGLLLQCVPTVSRRLGSDLVMFQHQSPRPIRARAR